MKIMKGEKIAFFSHFIGAIAALAGTIGLVYFSRSDAKMMTAAFIYGISITFLFTASSLYHAHKKTENEETLWRKLDHLAIFFMIAGSYTPVCLLYLEGTMLKAILIAQWSLVLFGFIFKFWFINAPRFLNIAIYLAMGWMAVIPMQRISEVMPSIVLFYLFAGAIFFTIGALVYLAKRPNFFKGTFGFHEIFHIFILLGGIMHYMMIFKGMAGSLAL